MADDYTNDTGTTGRLMLGGTISGNHETTGDVDIFRIFLSVGEQVQFDLRGSATDSGTESDPYLRLYNSGLVELSSDDDSGEGYNARLTYTAPASDYYYVGSTRSDIGTYTLTTTPLNFYKNTGSILNGHTLYTVDGEHGLQINDLSVPNHLVTTGSYETAGEATDVAIVGVLAYVADGSAGLQIVNVSNSAAPTFVASFDTLGTATGVAVSADNYAYIADSDKGLQIVDVYTPSTPGAGGTYDTSGYAFDVATNGHYVYVADGMDGLIVIDVTNPLFPVKVGSFDTTGNALGVTLNGKYAYVADGASGVQVIDVSNPLLPVKVGGYDTAGTAVDVTIKETTAYVADSGSGIQVLNLNNPIAPIFVKTLDTTGFAANLTIGRDYAYVGGSGDTEAVRFTTNTLPTGNVTISGNAVERQTLTAHNTLVDADDLGDITYTWTCRTTVVVTGNTYTLTTADVGKTFFVTANYVDGAGVAEKMVSAVTPVVMASIANNHAPTGTVSIMGNAVEGQVLTAGNTLTDEDGLGAITYQWSANNNAINGATAGSYTLTSDNIGATITVLASYTDLLGTPESKSSTATAAVAAAGTVIVIPPSGTAGVTISGTDFSTNEQGDTAAFGVKLNAAPARDVTITFTSSDLTEGVVTHPALTFTSANWATPQTFTVTGQNDALIDGSVAYSIAGKVTTLDVIYKNITVNSLTVTNQDTPVIHVETINGGDGVDILRGTDAPSYMLGKAGDDDMAGAGGNDTLWGSYGNDVMSGDNGNDVLNGEQDDDYLEGGAGNDTLDGGLGLDTLVGGAGNDVYYLGYDAVDVITDNGLATDVDTVIMPYQLTRYTLAAGIENATIAPGTQTSNLTGNTGNNTLIGNAGSNTLNGAVGRDSLFGGVGNDILNGGVGNDTLMGGAGKDTFLFNSSLSTNVDKITDFIVVDDTIKLENAIFTHLTATGVLSMGSFVKGAGALDTNDYIIYNPATGTVTYDSDGSGPGAGIQIALLGLNLGVTNADFVVT